MSSFQSQRRRDPYPWTWEVPVGVGVLAFVVLSLGVQLGRAVALFAAVGRWRMPASVDLFVTIPAILGGDASAGLSGISGQPLTRPELIAWIAVVELVVLVGLIVVARFLLVRWGPGRPRGMASAVEAERMLGRSRLRRNAAVIRPDLYRPRRWLR